MPRFPASPQLFDVAGFEAEAAQVAALASLATSGPGSARDILNRIERAAAIAGEPLLPFKHATLYAVLHELEFSGAVAASVWEGSDRRVYSIATRGRSWLAQAQERWRAAHLVIRAAAAPREASA